MIAEIRKVLAEKFAAGEIDYVEIRTDGPGTAVHIGRGGVYTGMYFDAFEVASAYDPTWIARERIDLAFRTLGVGR